MSEDTGNIDAEGDEIRRRGLSENSYNFVAYYDDNKFSVRLAYNWRDDFVRRGQLDLSANYKETDSLKVNFSEVNLNDFKSVRYMKCEQLVNDVGSAGTSYNLGLVYRF